MAFLVKWVYGFSTHCFKGWSQNLRKHRPACTVLSRRLAFR